MNDNEQPLVIRVRQGAVDNDGFHLGIVRFAPDGRAIFMNRASSEMVGEQLPVGTRLSELDLDAISRENVRVAIQERFEAQRGSSYQLRVSRKDNGTHVSMHVSAVPEYDANGELIGSIAFLIDESIDLATMAIHHAIQQSTTSTELFDALCEQLHEVIGFESMVITGISENRRHLQRLFEDPPSPVELQPTKWWPMPPFVQAMFDNFEAGPLNLEILLNSPEFEAYARTDPNVEQFRKRGFKHSLRLGVYRAGQLVATVSFMRRRPVPFTNADLARCIRLPIAEAVSAAMTLDRQNHLQFGLDLINEVAKVAESITQVATCLVVELKRHYGWEHVSLFHIDEDRRRLRMICQAGDEDHRLPENYDQSFKSGLIGKAYENRVAVNIGDVDAVPKDEYTTGIPGTKSEMVLPVPGSKLRWLLNVESSLRDAFADEEQASVERLLRVAGFILDRTATLELKAAILKSVADAVIQTDSMGVILDANAAAERLLGRPLVELQQRSLALFIVASGVDDRPPPRDERDVANAQTGWSTTQTAVSDQNPGMMLLQSSDWPASPFNMIRADGSLVPVLISAAPLPTDLGGKVFVASDLTNQRRVEQMELLKNVFRQIASEIRIPLALAATFLGDAAQQKEAASELIDKSLKQIRKADLPLERVIRLSTIADDTPLPQTIFDLRETLDDVVNELPRGDASNVRVAARENVVLVEAARHELMFCIQSLLAYLIRQKSQAAQVEIKIGNGTRYAFVTFALSDSREVAQTRTADPPNDLALAEPVIDGLMRRMGGSYDSSRQNNFRFRLLLKQGEKNHGKATYRS